jgi:hyperosmotically inducible protein
MGVVEIHRPYHQQVLKEQVCSFILFMFQYGKPGIQHACSVGMKKSILTLLVAASVALASDHAKTSVSQHQDPWVQGAENENKLVREVRHELLMLPNFGVFDDLGFSVDGSTVTLVGDVTRPMLKSQAENVVKRLEGVNGVVNRIEVLPLSPFDDRIRMAAYRAVYGDPALSTRCGFRAILAIHIIVKNGNIRLEGVVANKMDHDIAAIRANGVSSAFSVVNDLRVEGGK